MTSAPAFILLSNDGKPDRLLNATEHLRKRLCFVKSQRQGRADPNPTIRDVEQSHLLLVNSNFRPFVAQAFDYQKQSNNGSFTINDSSDSETTYEIQQYGDFIHDMAWYVQITYPSATPLAATADDTIPGIRACAYPGERLFKETTFEVNGGRLDDYRSETYTFHRQFRLEAGKQTGWKRMMGQEVPYQAYLNDDDSLNSVAGATVSTGKRIGVTVVDGHQTPTAIQTAAGVPGANPYTPPVLRMWIPGMFWFNLNMGNALASVAIPQGQRYVKQRVASRDELFGVTTRGAGTGATLGSITNATSTFYVNNVFLLADVHEIYIRRVTFQLIRVHRRHTKQLRETNQDIHLNQIKWPVEQMFVGAQDRVSTTVASGVTDDRGSSGHAHLVPKYLDRWNKYSYVTPQATEVQSVTGAAATGGALTRDARAVYFQEEPMFEWITLRFHGVELYQQMPASFFNSYVCWKYGDARVQTPEDPGLLFITFCAHPGMNQVTGHVNISRARETYIQYQALTTVSGNPAIGGTTSVNNSDTAEFLVLVVALNFLLLSDGNATLRYTT